MAKKQTEKFVDITKTGAQSYRDLQNQNNIPESADKIASFADASKYFKYTGQQAIADNQAANAQWEDYQEQSPLYRQTGGTDYLGNSIYDNDILVGDDDYYHISDMRGRNQPWYAQLGAGLLKGVGLAGSTFIDGTLGLVVGTTEAISQGDISKLWDNEVSNGLHNFNQAMEEWLPNYRTEEEQNRPWYANLGTMNFWADSFLKNMGFTVGALYSGGIWTKGLKLAGKAIQEAGKGMEFANAANKTTKAINKVGEATKSLGIAMQTNGLGAKLTGSLFSAVNEGRIEANNTTSDLRDLQVQQASDAFAKRRQEIIDNTTLSEEEKIEQLADLDGNYQATLDQIDENLKKAGLTDFLLNIPILALDNFWTFGRMYAQGFNNARNVAGKNVKKSFLGRASQAANEAADAAENTLAQNTKKEAGRFTWKEITNKQSLGKGLMIGLREGNEEMAQAWASEFAGNNAFYSDGPDTYYRAMSDPKALQETMDSWEAASKAFANTYGNADKYEEFAIGALTGLLGTPTFGKSQNASANTWLGRGKMIGLSGGIFGEFKSNAEMNKNGYAHVTNMNAALDKRDQIDKTARIHAAMNQFNNVMDGFAESDDKFEYQNASDNLDWMGITSFISTGREEDLKTLLGQDFDNISDEELEAIATFTSQNDNSNVGGFREKGSGRLITANSPQSDKDEMRQKLNKAKEKMLDEVDAYKTSVDIIRNYAAGNPNVTEEEINELAWMHWKTSRFDRRASEIKQDNAEQFTLIAQALEDFKKKQQEIIDKEEESTEGLSAAAMSVAENRNAQLSKAKKDAQKNLEYADELLGIINSVAGANKSIMPFLAPMLQMDKGFLDGVLKSDNFYNLAINRGLSKPEFDKAVRDIRDLGRLAEANNTFNNKLKEYIEDPLKQKKDHDKVDTENDAVAQEINKETSRKRAKKVTRQQILNGEADADDVIKNTKTDDVERQMAQDAKVTAQVGQKVESMIAKQNQEGTLSDEDAARIESTIQQGIAQSQSINDLTGSNAAFMVDANGQPLSDEQIALIQDLMDKATKEVAEANGLNIKDGEINFSKVEEAVQSQTGPTEKQTKAVEEAIAKEEAKTTGNDAVEKAVAINSNGVQGNPEKAIRKGRTNRSSSKSQQKEKKSKDTSAAKRLNESKKEKKAATKAAKEKAKQETIAKKKNSIVSTALTFAINGNAINVSTPEGQQETQLLSNILSKAYDLINEGKIEKLSGIMEVLKSMDEFEKLQQMLGRDPNLGSALKSISDNLKKEFTPEDDSIDDAAELERILGPETTSNEVASPVSFSSQNLNPAINIPNYFAPATSQYYRDPKTGQILPVPFTAKMQSGNKARKKKLEATYNYLTQNEAFKNASRVKAGDDIYFTVHPNLNTAAGGVVILMSTDPEGKHIVGDLADTESYTYENNALLKSMVDRITKEFNEREDKDSSEPFISKETSTVRQSMVGHVMFTNSKNAAGDKTLNGVFGDGQFKMGVANRAGGIITTNQGDESVSGNLDIITPKTRFTPGTPVVLIPSGEGTNQYVAVPFQMSKYDSSMRGSKFHKYAESVLKRVLLNKDGELIDLSSNKTQVLIKNALNALFNGDFHVNFTNGQLVIHQTIKTVKDSVTEKKNDILFRGTPNAGIVNNILNALQAKGMTIRIDRREINKDSNLKDLDFSYNTMIGDLAHTNLSDKSSTTVNDWFIVNPVNERGEEININRVEYRDTRTEKAPAQRNDTKVTYKGNEYLVSEEDILVDKDGNPRTDVNVTEQQIILAKAEIEKNDLATPIGTEGEQIFWYSLGNGNLFYNKDGEERVVVSETDKQAVKNSLTKKEKEPSTQTPSGLKNEASKEEPTKSKYPAGFNSQDQKDFFDAMPKKRQKQLMDANPNAISAILPYINSVIHDFGIEDLDEAEDDIDDIFDKLTSTKYRAVDEVEEYTKADIEAEKAWLKKALPQLSDDDHIRIVEGLIKIARKDNPGYAYGKTQQGIMTISDAAATGTVYHEAFHSVIDVLLTEDEINNLFVAGAKRYGIERSNLDNELAIEENLAEDFRRYVQREQAYQKDLEQSSGISKIFKILKHTAKIWLDNTSYINNIFYRINKGHMANRVLRNNRNIERFNQYTDEEKAILDRAPRNSEGRLLAPNNEVSNLTEKQYAQVRTKAFKEWFGDWEKGLTIKQDDKSYYRGQYDEPIIDKNGNLILKGKRDELYIKSGYNIDKGVSATTDMITANEYGETRHLAYISNIEDKYGELDNSWEKEEEINEIIEHGYYLIQFPKNISNEVIKEAGEVKLVGDVIIPKGSYVIQHITNDNIETIATATNNASKIVDENGEPLVTWHSTLAEIKNNIFRDYENITISRNEEWFTNKNIYDYKKEGYIITNNDILEYNKGNKITIKRPNGIYSSSERDVSNTYTKKEYEAFDEYDQYTDWNADHNAEQWSLEEDALYDKFKEEVENNVPEEYKAYNIGIDAHKEYVIKEAKKRVDEEMSKRHPQGKQEFISPTNPYDYSDNILGSEFALFNSIKNPLIVDANYSNWNEIEYNNEIHSTRSLEKYARDNGYDGIIVKNVYDVGSFARKEGIKSSTIIASFNSNQIKSATNNVGTFDINNPDIRYRESTITPKDIQQYHKERLDYSNLDNAQKALFEDRGITEEQYSFLTQAEKENLIKCLI